MIAGPGRWHDNTDAIRDSQMDLDPKDQACPPGVRGFYVRCGGCPWGLEIRISEAMLEDWPMPGTMRTQGWGVDPLRCPYCTGAEPRPDDPNAAPYPVAQEG